MRIMRVAECLVAMLMCGGELWAQTLYKSIRPDGSVEYSSTPSRDAVRIETYEKVPASPEDAARAASQRAEEQRRLRQFEERERRREQALDKADAELNSALDALRTAQQRLKDGIEPQAGEQTGTVRGITRRNDAYFERTQRLSQEVSDAQRRLERAYAARNAVRE